MKRAKGQSVAWPRDKVQAENQSKNLPICVFGLMSDQNNAALRRDLGDCGIRSIFAYDVSQVIREQLRPECFAVFIDLKTFPQLLDYVREKKLRPPRFWVGISNKLSTSQSTSLYNMGFADVLTMPVHPYTYKSRARQLLARFARELDFPEHVDLPTGITRKPKSHIHDLSPDNEEGAEAQTSSTVYLAGSSGIYGNHKVSTEKLVYYDNASKKVLPTRKLFEIVSPEDRKNLYIKEVGEKGAEAILWTHHQKWKANFKVAKQNTTSNALMLEHPKVRSATQRERVYKELAENSELFVSIALKRARIFSKIHTKDIELHLNGLKLQLPADFFETQRRSNFRLLVQGESNKMEIQIGSGIGIKEQNRLAVDIGAGGCRLQLPHDDLARFKVEQVLPRIRFQIYNKWIECSAVIRWKKGDFMGLQFIHLKKQDQQGLQLFVMEESYAYLKNYVLPELA